MISHKHRCIFIHIPKCAGTSIETSLGHYDDFSGRRGQDHRSLRMIEQPLFRKHFELNSANMFELYHRLKHQLSPRIPNPRNKWQVTPEQFQQYFKFTIVRNPWSRAFSWYKNANRDSLHQQAGINANQSFKSFLFEYAGKGMLRTQIYWLKSFSGDIQLDFIGRFERLEQDFSIACSKMGLTDQFLPHRIQGANESYKSAYDNEMIDLVATVYREEIAMFEYEFE